ncbi:MarR family winged helix-turn-helix transcriptional regulator [Roseateles koreensis]|uniref:MarR family transcriptional regulator n=1 Tax=Roseateles koreensis TaxID=2987526 RepID=A0ABT5KWE3_9BURK|nr:MarR family transcriptional regulator [Roseateles koreensis]MDC8787258.1 MarR family transcriptional regulator [Roseateles koreensis]
MRKQVDIVNHISPQKAEEVLESVHSVMHLFRARQFRALRDGSTDLTHMDVKVLGFFARHPGATPSDLVVKTGRDKAQIARLISGLRAKGLLDAQPDPSDRRALRLLLTPAGQEAHKAVRAEGRQLSAQAVAGLSEDDCERLLGLMKQIKDNLERAI